jgi:hypothetical protein
MLPRVGHTCVLVLPSIRFSLLTVPGVLCWWRLKVVARSNLNAMSKAVRSVSIITILSPVPPALFPDVVDNHGPALLLVFGVLRDFVVALLWDLATSFRLASVRFLPLLSSPSSRDTEEVDPSCRAPHRNFAELVLKQRIENCCFANTDVPQQSYFDLKRLEKHGFVLPPGSILGLKPERRENCENLWNKILVFGVATKLRKVQQNSKKILFERA